MSDPPDPGPPDLTALPRQDRLRAALRRRAAVGRAVGIVMERRHCSPALALDLLGSAARHRDIELHELCARLVGGFGERPGEGDTTRRP
ncbi:ANTAR domain-containing protein [Streptomyces polygonati]|uniref:ANTAR domain-containing protein n=1 Tax=Streptomyces polygonati TaxID=1617087 RepID=A0ABV8HPY3_9ACTN